MVPTQVAPSVATMTPNTHAAVNPPAPDQATARSGGSPSFAETLSARPSATAEVGGDPQRATPAGRVDGGARNPAWLTTHPGDLPASDPAGPRATGIRRDNASSPAVFEQAGPAERGRLLDQAVLRNGRCARTGSALPAVDPFLTRKTTSPGNSAGCDPFLNRKSIGCNGPSPASIAEAELPPSLAKAFKAQDPVEIGCHLEKGIQQLADAQTDPGRKNMYQMLLLQKKMHDVGQVLEIAAKVVEHGTSGVKTVLQTQA